MLLVLNPLLFVLKPLLFVLKPLLLLLLLSFSVFLKIEERDPNPVVKAESDDPFRPPPALPFPVSDVLVEKADSVEFGVDDSDRPERLRREKDSLLVSEYRSLLI